VDFSIIAARGFSQFGFSIKFGVLGIDLFILLYLSYFVILVVFNSNFDPNTIDDIEQ